jgi:hypothetical protein
MEVPLNARAAVKSLLFPVKRMATLLAIWGLAGCGYQAVYSGTPPGTRLSVTSATHQVAESAAIDAVLTGVRQGLAEQGVLASGEGHPTLVVEVVRVDEVARGLIAEMPAGDSLTPTTSRGAGLAVVARGWVVEHPGASPSRDTTNVRRQATYAHAPGAVVDAIVRREALRAAGMETGRALARWVLGEPQPAVQLF